MPVLAEIGHSQDQTRPLAVKTGQYPFLKLWQRRPKKEKRRLLASWQNGLPDVEVVPWVALGEATGHNVTPSGP
jgi:hypothetical protein